MLEPFRYDFVTCLWLISFKNTGVIRIWFWHIFTICFPQKCWNHLDMVMLHICHLFASKILASFGYVSVTYLLLICFEILASFEYGSVVCCSRNYFRVFLGKSSLLWLCDIMASEMYQKCELGRFDWFWKMKKSSQKDDRF